jgi:hypothetical protein
MLRYIIRALAACSFIAAILASEITTAEPVTYEIYGYVSRRVATTPHWLPAEFIADAPMSGSLTFDPEHTRDDTDGFPIRDPLIGFTMRSAAGGLVIGGGVSDLRELDSGSLIVESSLLQSSGPAPFADLRLRWSSPIGGQLPEPIGTLNIADLQPNSWDLTLAAQDPRCLDCEFDIVDIHIVLLARWGSSFDTLDNFANPPAGWINGGGSWFWSPNFNGYWTNAANTSFTSTTYSGRELKRNFSVDAELFPEWTKSGNTFGLLFNYLNASNFYEVRLNSQGTATLSKVVGGTRSMIETGRYNVLPFRAPVRVVVEKSGSDITVRVPNIISSEPVIRTQDATLSRGHAGAFASWNKVRVDEFSIRQTQLWTTELSRFDTAANWTPVAGSWVAQAGEYRNTTNQVAAISVAATPIFAHRYAIHASLNLEWSKPGNRGGLVYDYVDARNYRAVLVQANNALPEGPQIELIEVKNGVRTVIKRSGGVFFSGRQWTYLSVLRIGSTTQVSATCKTAGAPTFCGQPVVNVTQPEVAGGRRVGLLASWNHVRFDDVVIATEN